MPPDTGATDINGGASRLSALLKSEQVPTDNQEAEVHEEQVQEQEVNDQLQAEEPQETPESDTEEEIQTYKVKVSGEDKEVTLEELMKGYMMESDYRHKTMNLSDKNKALDAKIAEIDQRLEDAQSVIEDEIDHLESEEMLELKEIDPEKYYKKYEKVQAKIKRFEDMKAKRLVERQEKQQEKVNKAKEELFLAFPTWSDQAVAAKEFGEIAEGLKGFGYNTEEVEALIDPRMFVMARKAALYDQIQKQNLADKKVKPKTKNMQPGTAKTKEDRQSTETKNLRQRLRQSGKVQDAAKLFSMK